MHKQILSLCCLLLVFPVHGMNNPLQLSDNPRKSDTEIALDLITERIISQHYHNHTPTNISLIKKLLFCYSCTNKELYNYYNQEKNVQIIIKKMSRYTGKDDYSIIFDSTTSRVAKKMKYFIEIANDKKKSFTTDDLKEEWYYNITQGTLRQPLLITMMQNYDFEKVKLVIQKVPLTFLYNDNMFETQSFLHTIADIRNRCWHEEIKKQLFTIAELLLKKGIQVDGRASIYQRTPLILASQHADQNFAHLLLEYGANPYSVFLEDNCYEHTYKNAFDMAIGWPEDWLKKMLDEVITHKNQNNSSTN